MAVYKKSSKNEPFKETDPLEPLSPYGISKLASEKYINVTKAIRFMIYSFCTMVVLLLFELLMM